jgi:hypothetical protein
MSCLKARISGIGLPNPGGKSSKGAPNNRRAKRQIRLDMLPHMTHLHRQLVRVDRFFAQQHHCQAIHQDLTVVVVVIVGGMWFYSNRIGTL